MNVIFTLTNNQHLNNFADFVYRNANTQEVVIKPNLRVVLKADAQKLDEDS